MFIFLKRICKLGWQNFCRDRETILPTIFVLFIPVFLSGFSLVVKAGGNYLIEIIKSKADVAVYFKENVKEQDILKIKNEFLANPLIKNIEYVSAEEAFEKFSERYKENPVYMESLAMVGKNPFLASLNISAHDVSAYEAINQLLERKDIQEIVDHTTYPKSKALLEQVFSSLSFLKKVGIFLLSTFLLFAILVNFNTVRLAILNSKLEIENQRMVGASNFFIQGPFLIQSIICGFLAGVVSFVILSFICWFFAPKLEMFLAGINLYQLWRENLGALIMVQFSVAVILALISTLLATRKYLKA